MMTGIPMPEGTITKRSLQFFWLADCSGSMSGRRIATLNQAIRESLPEIRNAVAAHPEVDIKMRAIKFATNASWHVGPKPVPLAQFTWPELRAEGTTATAQALRLLASEISVEKMPQRGFPPVCILVSDGFCTDPEHEYDQAIDALLKQPWAIKAVRLAIAIGEERDYDEAQLRKFVSHPEVGLLKAHKTGELVAYIRWASVSASIGASIGKSWTDGNITSNVHLPPPPQINDSTDLF